VNLFVLDDENRTVLETDQVKWGEFFGSDRRLVNQHELGESFVSTVFLGIDHNFSGVGPPLLFETLVQGGPMNDHMERYSTWDEAVAGHCSVLRVLAEPSGTPWHELAKPVNHFKEKDAKTLWDRLASDDDLLGDA
jgi:hypothetical protein